MTVFVFNGWAAEADAWSRTTFPRTRLFSYIEQLDGEPERAMDAADGDVVLVGFSMGGSTALRMLLRHPEKVRGLVLVSATARMMAQPDEGWVGMSPRRFEAFAYGVELLSAENPSPLFDRAQLRRGLDYLIATDIRAELERLVAEEPRLRTAAFPVEILHSERDGIVRPANVAYLKGLFPQAEVTWVPGAEHTLPASVPETIDAAVARVCGGREP